MRTKQAVYFDHKNTSTHHQYINNLQTTSGDLNEDPDFFLRHIFLSSTGSPLSNTLLRPCTTLYIYDIFLLFSTFLFVAASAVGHCNH
jgi:hypothetical protein